MSYTTYRVYGEVQQFKAGLLNTLQFDQLIAVSPEVVRCLLTEEKFFGISAAKLQELLTIEYSPQGSNYRLKEEAIIFNLFTFLQDSEGILMRRMDISRCCMLFSEWYA